MAFSIVANTNSNAISARIRSDALKYPKIFSSALNSLAFHARKDEQESMRKELDRPKRFSQNAILYSKASFSNMRSSVYINPRNDYLHYMVLGGVRTPKVKRIFIPSQHLRTDASGNISRTRRRNIVKNPKTFKIRTKKGKELLMRRKSKRKLEVVANLKDRTLYRTTGYWDFYGTAIRTYDRRFNGLVVKAHDRFISRKK